MPWTTKIYGPPGTGKTTTLISMLKTVLASGTPPTRVAYITHTKAACVEVRDRVAEELNLKKGDMKWFRTIHSTCFAMTSLNIGDVWGNKDCDDFNTETDFNLKGSFDVEALEEFDDDKNETDDIVLFAHQLATSRMVPLSQIIPEMPVSAKLASPHAFLDAYQQFKNERGKLDFMDMLTQYNDGPHPAGPVDVVFVDEAQDLSRLQWEIVHKFAANARELHLAGDDDQSIYRFLGADEYGFLDHPSDEDNVLTHSYRVPKAIGEYAAHVIGQIKRRKMKEVVWQDKPGGISNHILDEMFLPWNEWAKGDESVMVLCRHRKQLYKVSRMLNELKVPHTLKGKSMATSPLGECIGTYLKLFHTDENFRPAVLAKMFDRLGDKTQAAEMRSLGASDRNVVLRIGDINLTYKDNWPSIFSRYKWEVAQIEALRKQINEYGLEVIGNKPNIDISTYHGSKGREADHVILFTDCYKQTWDEQENDPDSEIRLAYVGLTRAKNSVTIIVPRTSMYLRALV